MGDPSFDTFRRTGTVHRSKEPYEWAVNGSLFAGRDGARYLYAGLYGKGYVCRPGDYSHFEIYRQTGSGWENLGPGLEPHYYFEDTPVPSSGCPDAVVFFDVKRGKYLLTYDWGTENTTWDNAYDSSGTTADAGAAVAWGDTPAGPFVRVPKPVFRNKDLHGRYGRFLRFYATTVIPRGNDYLALILCDSAQNYAWGLAAAVAQTPESGFTMPEMVLSADKEDYYPAPMEFFPAFVVGGYVYAPATSVCLNRNYQVIFKARLEDAHKPEAWEMAFDGSVWHSEYSDDESCGIWGQTINGYVGADGVFDVMFPSRDKDGFGTLSTASRRWDEPYGDGFTLSGHQGPSVTLTRDSYRVFTLDAEFTLSGGFADIIFDHPGKIGADAATSDCRPCGASLGGYRAVRVEGGSWKLIDRGNVVLSGETNENITSLRITRGEGRIKACVGEEVLFDAELPNAGYKPLGVRTGEFTVFKCRRFAVEGETVPSLFIVNSVDALLGGGVGECNFRREDGLFIGGKRVKWNVVCSDISIVGRTMPGLSRAEVRADGRPIGHIDFGGRDDGYPKVLIQAELPLGRHGIELLPEGDIAVPELIALQGVRKEIP